VGRRTDWVDVLSRIDVVRCGPFQRAVIAPIRTVEFPAIEIGNTEAPLNSAVVVNLVRGESNQCSEVDVGWSADVSVAPDGGGRADYEVVSGQTSAGDFDDSGFGQFVEALWVNLYQLRFWVM
jgi:hypothetical protein